MSNSTPSGSPPPDPTPPIRKANLLTSEQMIEALGLNTEGRSPQAAYVALDGLWRRVQRVRHDKKLKPLLRVRIGRHWRYYPDAVELIIDSLAEP